MQVAINKKFALIGFSAALLLLFLYFSVLSLAESFYHAYSQFLEMWYWILILAAGFGTQVGLFVFIKEKQIVVSGKTMAASGSISTGAMITCCLHHVTDVLALMGLAAVAVFLTQYQLWFITLGILSNIIGITIMLEIIQKHNLGGNFLNKLLVYNMGKVKKIIVGFSLVILSISFFWTNSAQTPTAALNGPDLSSQVDSRGGVSFGVAPLNFNINEPLKFEIKIDTHSGSLDFDLAKISFLEDDNGNKYEPLEWQGPSPGGHHLEGVLIFPIINKEAKKIKLTIQDSVLRIFEWDLK